MIGTKLFARYLHTGFGQDLANLFNHIGVYLKDCKKLYLKNTMNCLAKYFESNFIQALIAPVDNLF